MSSLFGRTPAVSVLGLVLVTTCRLYGCCCGAAAVGISSAEVLPSERVVKRHHAGDLFRVYDDVAGDVGVGHRHDSACGRNGRRAVAVPWRDGQCQCRTEATTFRQDLGRCVNSIEECRSVTFRSPVSTDNIPLVRFPSPGKLVYPNAEIALSSLTSRATEGSYRVISENYLTVHGWNPLSNITRQAAPLFQLVRRSGKFFLQFIGLSKRSDLPNIALDGHLILLELTRVTSEAPPATLTTPLCVAFRVEGNNEESESPTSASYAEDSLPESASGRWRDWTIIGLGVGLLGVTYVLAILVYLAVKKRQERKLLMTMMAAEKRAMVTEEPSLGRVPSKKDDETRRGSSAVQRHHIALEFNSNDTEIDGSKAKLSSKTPRKSSRAENARPADKISSGQNPRADCYSDHHQSGFDDQRPSYEIVSMLRNAWIRLRRTGGNDNNNFRPSLLSIPEETAVVTPVDTPERAQRTVVDQQRRVCGYERHHRSASCPTANHRIGEAKATVIKSTSGLAITGNWSARTSGQHGSSPGVCHKKQSKTGSCQRTGNKKDFLRISTPSRDRGGTSLRGRAETQCVFPGCRDDKVTRLSQMREKKNRRWTNEKVGRAEADDRQPTLLLFQQQPRRSKSEPPKSCLKPERANEVIRFNNVGVDKSKKENVHAEHYYSVADHHHRRSQRNANESIVSGGIGRSIGVISSPVYYVNSPPAPTPTLFAHLPRNENENLERNDVVAKNGQLFNIDAARTAKKSPAADENEEKRTKNKPEKHKMKEEFHSLSSNSNGGEKIKPKCECGGLNSVISYNGGRRGTTNVTLLNVDDGEEPTVGVTRHSSTLAAVNATGERSETETMTSRTTDGQLMTTIEKQRQQNDTPTLERESTVQGEVKVAETRVSMVVDCEQQHVHVQPVDGGGGQSVTSLQLPDNKRKSVSFDPNDTVIIAIPEAEAEKPFAVSNATITTEKLKCNHCGYGEIAKVAPPRGSKSDPAKSPKLEEGDDEYHCRDRQSGATVNPSGISGFRTGVVRVVRSESSAGEYARYTHRQEAREIARPLASILKRCDSNRYECAAWSDNVSGQRQQPPSNEADAHSSPGNISDVIKIVPAKQEPITEAQARTTETETEVAATAAAPTVVSVHRVAVKCLVESFNKKTAPNSSSVVPMVSARHVDRCFSLAAPPPDVAVVGSSGVPDSLSTKRSRVCQVVSEDCGYHSSDSERSSLLTLCSDFGSAAKPTAQSDLH